MNSIYDTVASLYYLKFLKEIIDQAEMTQLLKTKGPFTIFAPHNGAFGTFTTYDPDDEAHEYVQASLDDLLTSKESAQTILNYLLVPERYTLEDLMTFTSITAVDGNDIPIDTTDGNIIIGNSSLMNSDIECANGIIHVTGELLQPTLIY